MSNKFRNKYRITTVRLQQWDYGWNAAYFVTICTAGRNPFFGTIPPLQKEMKLSGIGQIVFDIWHFIPEQFPFVVLDEFVIMPDHIHGIIIIAKNGHNDSGRAAINRGSTEINRGSTGINRASTNADFHTDPGGVTGNKNPMLHDNLSRIIRWFKGRVTFECRKINPGFQWQSGYHEHIIRGRESHERIKNYIRNNPLHWHKE